jgi:hypothetical protein
MAAATMVTVAAMAAVLPKLSALLMMQEKEGEDGRGFIISGGARRDATFLRDEVQKLRRYMDRNSLGNIYLHMKQEEDAWALCPTRKLRDLLSDIEDTLDGRQPASNFPHHAALGAVVSIASSVSTLETLGLCFTEDYLDLTTHAIPLVQMLLTKSWGNALVFL